MKLLTLVILFLLSASTWAISISLKLEEKTLSPKVTRMSCEGRTCSCPEDTILDRSSMQCLKCEPPSVLDSQNRCIDPNMTNEAIIEYRFFTPEMTMKLNSQASVSPTNCDITSMNNGKFTSCQCPNIVEKFPFTPGKKRLLAVMYERMFNAESQKCERKTRYAVGVQNISCYGPSENAFKQLSKLGLLEASYDAPDMSLGMCGAEDGMHILLLNKDENSGEMSILDAISYISNGPDTHEGRRIMSFKIDTASLNY